MKQGTVIAILGPNASGKTRYVDELRKRLASDSVRYIAFRDSYGVGVDNAYYLQLRWNQHDIDAETPTAGQLLERTFHLTGADTPGRRHMQQQLYQLFHLDTLLDKYIITLSSGELRKFQLTKTLLSQPRILIMDNPFIGLDSTARRQLYDLLKTLADEQPVTIYLVVSRPKDVPDYVDQVIPVAASAAPSATHGDCPHVHPMCTEGLSPVCSPHVHRGTVPCVLEDSPLELCPPVLAGTVPYHSDEVVSMRDVSIRYGERTILQSLTWTVRCGERWALSGDNGSGKSTLLSLVCADNPQSYACDISLFGHPRGSGESIWDIKKHIGYVSPEMHRSYHRDLPCLRIVASGLKDTVGLYVRPNAAEQDVCRWWMQLFGILHLADRSFLQVSSGEQRLVLLARAFVKDPDLLILDEPLHGLDDANRQLVRAVIEAYCRRPRKTLIMVTHYEEELPPCIDHKLRLTKH